MFSMCSELTPRAHIPDTRIPQLMQPWPALDIKTYIFGILLQFVKIWHHQKRWVFFFRLRTPSGPMWVEMTYFLHFFQTIAGVLIRGLKSDIFD